MGHEDAGQFIGVLADGGEAGEGILAAEPRVDEDPGTVRADEGAVAGAGTREYAKLDDAVPPPSSSG